MFLKISDVKDFTCGFLKSLWKFVLAIFQTRNEQNNMGNMSGIVVKKATNDVLFILACHKNVTLKM